MVPLKRKALVYVSIAKSPARFNSCEHKLTGFNTLKKIKFNEASIKVNYFYVYNSFGSICHFTVFELNFFRITVRVTPDYC